MQNRTVGITSNITLKRDAKGALEIVDIKRTLGLGFSFFMGDLWAMVFEARPGEYCQLSLKPNFAIANKQFMEELAKPVKPKPYIWGQDEYSQARINPNFRAIFANPDNYEFE